MSRILLFAVMLFASALACAQVNVQQLLLGDDWERAISQLSENREQTQPDLLKALTSDNTKLRAKAAQAIGEVDMVGKAKAAPEVIEALAKAGKDKQAEVRAEAIRALAYALRVREWGHHGEPWLEKKDLAPLVGLGREASNRLSDIITGRKREHDEDYGVKVAIAKALGLIGDPGSMAALAKLVNESDGFLLSAAMSSVAQLDHPGVVDLLVGSIEKSIASYSDTPGVWALKSMKGRAVPGLIQALEGDYSARQRTLIVHSLLHIRDRRALPALQKALRDPDSHVRASAADALGVIPDPSSIPLLRNQLNDTEPEARTSALAALGSLKATVAFEQSVSLLKDADDQVRARAIVTVAELGGRRAIPLLIPFLKQNDLQRCAITALKGLKAIEAEDALIEVLQTGEEYAKNEAAEALGDLKSAKAIPLLVKILQHKDWYPRTFAARSLSAIGAPAADPLLTLLTTAPADVKPYAIEALGGSGDPRAVEALLPLVRDPDLGGAAMKALGRLGDTRAIEPIRAMLNGPADSRSEAAEALGDLKATAAVPELLKALTDPTEYVPMHAVEALGKIADPRALGALLDIARNKPDFECRWMAMEALGSYRGVEVVEALEKELSMDDWPSSAAAARALGKVGDARALPALRKALESSEDERTQTDAAEAIALITKKQKK